VRVEFRRGQVNAFALPGGVIVLFDELVELAESDERLLGVLGHELGHVVHRHSTRQLFQALGTGALAGLIWGDFSAVVANAPVVLGVMRYGRAFEQEADAYSLEFLRANGLSPRPLYEFMTRVQSVDEKDRSNDIPDFLSTHPHPAERIEWLRRETEAYERREK
jgi:predicted Zn-dependent protease